MSESNKTEQLEFIMNEIELVTMMLNNNETKATNTN